jgi:hypothetical protein
MPSNQHLRALWGVVVLATVCHYSVRAQILISEVHAVPAGGEPEWVELENVSAARVDLTSWIVCDNRTCVRLPSVHLDAGQRAVVVRDTASLRESRSIGRDAVLIEARLPTLNNTTDQVILRRADSTLVDSSFYRVSVRGRSLERAGNTWLVCLARDSATCGMLNSTVRLLHDLRCASVRAGHGVPSIEVVVEQWGLRRSTSRTLTVDDGSRRHSIAVPPIDVGGEWVGRIGVDELGKVTGRINVRAWLNQGDDRVENDTVESTMVLPPPFATLVVTEVMFDPGERLGDYVEIYNAGVDTASLEGWMLADQVVDGHRDTAVIVGALRLLPGEFGVVSVDTNVRRMMDVDDRPRLAFVRRSFNIDASGDDVVLLTPSGFIADAVRVEASWHERSLPTRKGIALERLAADVVGTERASWASSGSLAGGTPGRANSVDLGPAQYGGHVRCEPSPFSTVIGHRLHPCRVEFEHPFRHGLVSLTVYDTEGNVVRRMLNAVLAGRQGSGIWDGRNDDNLAVAPGPYFVRIEVVDASSSRTFTARTLVVVGE